MLSLQSAHSTLVQEHASLRSQYTSLQDAYGKLERQIEDVGRGKNELKVRLAEKDAVFESEVGGLRRLVSMLEDRSAHQTSLVESIEKSLGQREAELLQRIQDLESVESTNAQLTQLIESLQSSSSSAPRDGAEELSPTVGLISASQSAGKSFTEIYTSYLSLQSLHSQKCLEYSRMESTLSQILAQIEERAPLLLAQRQEFESLQKSSKELEGQCTVLIREKGELERELKRSVVEREKLGREVSVGSQVNEDLGRQIQHLLHQIALLQDPSSSVHQTSYHHSTNGGGAQDMISDTLVPFKDVSALQTQNEKLLRLTRSLTLRLEEEEAGWRDDGKSFFFFLSCVVVK